MEKQVIIVTGKNGQLGSELKDIAVSFPQFDFHFFDRAEFDICSSESIKAIFEKYKPAFFINTAAYTAVDKAETEQKQAFLINAEAVGNIATACKTHTTKLIHISTDYVFKGNASKPYKENDDTDPVNYYGYTKRVGEQRALQNNSETIVMRTAWVYSAYGNNFVKTMLRLMNERNDINVVNDQFGSPTYAKDIAVAIMQIIVQSRDSFKNGIYHFSNDGIISWYEFAKAIKEIKKLQCSVHAIPASAYPTPAKRPHYSGLDKTKITATFQLQLKPWQDSLQACLSLL